MSDIGILVPLAGIALGGCGMWFKHQRRMAELQLGVAAEQAARHATRNQELEERVRVLERIVTDKGYDVSAQIEALRDVQKVAAGRHDADGSSA